MANSIETKMPEAFVHGKLLSCKQAQEMLGVSQATLFRLLASKKDTIPSVKIGSSRKFQLEKLLHWIENHAV